jgi:Ca-activated chloride channel family protein
MVSKNLAATTILVAFLVSTSSILAQQPAQTSKPIILRVTIVDKDERPVIGLRREEFAVTENKKTLDITYFDAHQEPISLAILFDVSGSIPQDLKELAAEAFYQLSQSGSNENEYLVIGFTENAKIVCDWTADQESLRKALMQVLQIQSSKGTALYDNCELGLHKLESSKHRRRALVVISDGMDNSSKSSFDRLRNAIRDSQTPVYSIASTMWSNVRPKGFDILQELTSMSGGKAYFAGKPNHVKEIIDNIGLQISNQYLIGFTNPNLSPDNKWHPIKITISSGRDQSIQFTHGYPRYRAGYYNR